MLHQYYTFATQQMRISHLQRNCVPLWRHQWCWTCSGSAHNVRERAAVERKSVLTYRSFARYPEQVWAERDKRKAVYHFLLADVVCMGSTSLYHLCSSICSRSVKSFVKSCGAILVSSIAKRVKKLTWTVTVFESICCACQWPSEFTQSRDTILCFMIL